MRNRSSVIVMLATAGLAVSLLGCSRTPSQADAEAAAAVEPPPVEEPFAVQDAPLGEEAIVQNPSDATATAPDATTAAPATPSTGTSTAAEPAAPAADAPDNSKVKSTNFKAYGNEPFWNAQVDDGMVLFATLENQDGVMLTAKRSGEGNKVIYSGDNVGKPFSFTFIERKCLDSMSGRPFNYWVSAKVDGRTMTGCAKGE